ncbi:hypothetical protein LCER1_G009186, partial [Lachnellula cervina]
SNKNEDIEGMSNVQTALPARAAKPRSSAASEKVATTKGHKWNEFEAVEDVGGIRSSEADIDLENTQTAPALEFVTITGRPAGNRAEFSKQVRSQVMRDYLWKHKQGVVLKAVESIDHPEEASRYKGRFKLSTWSHKAKIKSKHTRQLRAERGEEGVAVEGTSQGHLSLPQLGITFGAGKLDPFNSFVVPLVSSSDRILQYYHTSYSMNSHAINPEGNFFGYASTDPAMLHSVLYLVALHRELKHGILGSRDGLHHGAEAFRIINERLQGNESFSDMTIAAVAMLANKENMNGNYDISKMHMRGLGKMIETRGGVQKLPGVFLRIVTW